MSKLKIFILFYLINILLMSFAQAQEYNTTYISETFPNTSISQSNTFSLFKDRTCELNLIMRLEFDRDFTWNPTEVLFVPIKYSSFTDEKPEIISVNIFDENIPPEIDNDTIFVDKSNSETYYHLYYIKVYPNTSIDLLHNKFYTLRITIKINETTSEVLGKYNKFIYNVPATHSENNINFLNTKIKVNLPNNPYYWSEIIDSTYSNYSVEQKNILEWEIENNKSKIILVDYIIHEDINRLELDNATKDSLIYAKSADEAGKRAENIAIIGLIIAVMGTIIAIPSFIELVPKCYAYCCAYYYSKFKNEKNIQSITNKKNKIEKIIKELEEIKRNLNK